MMFVQVYFICPYESQHKKVLPNILVILIKKRMSFFVHNVFFLTDKSGH